MGSDLYIYVVFAVSVLNMMPHVFCSLMQTCDVHVHGHGNCNAGLHGEALTLQKYGEKYALNALPTQTTLAMFSLCHLTNERI